MDDRLLWTCLLTCAVGIATFANIYFEKSRSKRLFFGSIILACTCAGAYVVYCKDVEDKTNSRAEKTMTDGPRVLPPTKPKPKPPSIRYEVSKYVAEDASATDVYVTVTGELHDPVFQVTCEIDCTFLRTQFVGGTSKFDRPGPEPATTIQGRFIIPSLMKEGDQIVFRLESYKPEPPKVVSVKLISAQARTD